MRFVPFDKFLHCLHWSVYEHREESGETATEIMNWMDVNNRCLETSLVLFYTSQFVNATASLILQFSKCHQWEVFLNFST